MRRAALLIALSAFAGAFGCNSVLGLNNFQVTDGTGGAIVGTGGASGGTSSGGTAGVAGVAGVAGAGMDAGGAAGGGAGGAAGGTGGAGGAPTCGSALTPNQNVVQTCVLRASCSPFVPDSTISDCISLNLQQAFVGAACTSAAKNCADVDSCQGYGYTTAAQCSGQTGWRCENNSAIDCTDGYYISCSRLGGQCQMYNSNGTLTADCEVVSSCTSGQSACQGDLAYTCINGVGYGMACSNFGAQCGMQNGQAACFLATQTCSGTLPPCSGTTTAQVCLNGRKQSYDCSSVGLVCKSDSNGPYCVSPGCTMADANNCAESCSGSTAHVCYGGVPYDIDCTKYGFSTCTAHDDKAPPAGIGHYVVCSN